MHGASGTLAAVWSPGRRWKSETGSRQLVDPDWHGPARGAYFHSFLWPRRRGVGAFGVHIHQGRIGAFFHPLLRQEPFVYTGVSHREFVERVDADHGIELRGSAIEPDPIPGQIRLV
jgi:hypothetical protein